MRRLALILVCLLATAGLPAVGAAHAEAGAAPGGLRILDKHGEVLAVLPASDGAYVEALSPDEIPRLCRDLFVRLEDKRFFRHHGVDPAALLRVGARRIASLLAGGPAAPAGGGSTITMQLARMLRPHPRTIAGKISEVRDAFRLELTLSKEEILTGYLTTVPFGYNARGVGAAARTYFDREIGGLDEAQLLVLALIPRNPRRFDPLREPETVSRAACSLSRRFSLGIGEEEIAAAVASARRGGPPSSRAPHFTRLVAGRLKEKAPPGALSSLFAGPVRTTLDAELNDFVQGRIRRHLDAYRGARITNAACIVMENATGAVRAWVGSRDFGDSSSSGQIDGALIRRQSASVIKPFLYGFALTRGWTPATLLPDVPLDFGQAETYRPVNFDRKSRGVVRLRTALGSSLNVPAVFTLSRLGVGPWMANLRDLGFDLPPDAETRYGLGAAVGNAEVSLLELVRAFSVFPRGGTLPEPVFLSGEVPSAGAAGGKRIYDKATAWLVADILSDPSARSTGFGTRTYFRTPFPAMFKSGTSSEFTNLWCLGATPEYTVGVWAGNFDGRAVVNKTGSIVPAQIVVDTLKRLTREARGFARPDGIVSARICTLTGKAAVQDCPSVRAEVFPGAASIPPPCTYHRAGAGREDLLSGSLQADGPAPVILVPLRGQHFSLDDTLEETVQRIPVLVSVPSGERLLAAVDGGELAPADSRFSLPALRGRHTLVVRTRGGEAAVSYVVD